MALPPGPLSLDTAVTLTVVLLGLGQLVAGLEFLSLVRSGKLERFLPWELVRLRGAGTRPRPRVIGALMDRLYSGNSATLLPIVRSCAAGATIALAVLHSNWLPLGLLVLLACQCLHQYRNIMGGEGSDQLSLILSAAMLLASLPFTTTVVRSAALLFVAAQLILSYTVSGLAKLVSPVWRSGDAIVGILSTADYGTPAFGRFLSGHRPLALLASWTVILVESTFVLSLTAQPALTAYLLIGISMHVGIALLMGLNAFLTSFLAAYPALVWLSNQAG